MLRHRTFAIAAALTLGIATVAISSAAQAAHGERHRDGYRDRDHGVGRR